MSGSAIKKPQTIDITNKSTNQQIYGEIRNLMDDAAKTYKAKKDFEERKREYIEFMQAQAQQQQAQAQQQQAQAQQQKGAVEASVSAQGADALEASASATN